MAQIGWVHALRGTPAEGINRIQGVIERLDQGIPSSGLAALYLALGRLWSVSDRQSEELAVTERAVEVARRAEDIRMLAAAQAARSGTLGMFERLDEALQAGEEAARLAETAGDLAALYFALSHTSGAHYLRGELVSARRLDDRAIHVAEQSSDAWEMMVARTSRCMRAICTGEWTLAQADIEATVSLRHQIGPSEATGFALLQHGRLCLYQGHWDAAVRHLEGSVALFERSRHVPHLRWAHSALAELDLLTGDPEKACRRLVGFLDEPEPTERTTAYVRPTLAWAYLEVGDLVKAKDVLSFTLSRARSTGNR
jgi:tetratricopeptide (TPR) repeat protein